MTDEDKFNGEKKIVEIYFTKWHPVNYEEQRSKIFAKNGFKTFFLNEVDLLATDWKRRCLCKLGVQYEGIVSD